MIETPIHPVVEELQARQVVAVLRAPDPDTAIDAVAALVDGGVSAIEITYSTPDVPRVLARSLQAHPGALIGVGTVTEARQVRESDDAGAAFIVCPGYDQTVVEAMIEASSASVIGGMTPTEMMLATRSGADVVKLFPAASVGPGYLRALREPFPLLRVMPTGGVSLDNLAAWFDAGALAVGASGSLCPPTLLAAGDFDEIRNRAGQFRQAADRARATSDANDRVSPETI